MIDVPIPVFDAVAAITVILAFGVLALALRGRRVDDHPICRRCGYDLFGKPETSTRCGECGADLNRRRAVRRGHRRRRVRLAWLSLLLLAAAGTKLGVDLHRVGVARDWAKYKPASWLARDTESSDVKLRDESRAEVSRRLNAHQLSAAWVDRLTQRALTIQADESKPWDTWWGDFVQDARGTSQLADEAWHRYLSQAWPMHLEAAPLQRRGPMVVVAAVVRDSPRHGKTLALAEASILKGSIAGQEVRTVSDSFFVRRYPSKLEGISLRPEQVDAVGDGPLMVSLTREMHVRRFTTTPVSRFSSQTKFGVDEFTATATLSEVQTTIAPADYVELDRDPTTAAAVRRAVSIARCTYGLPDDAAPGAGEFGPFVVRFSVRSPPQALAYDVLLRTSATARRTPPPQHPVYFRLGQLTCPEHFQGELVVRYGGVPDFRLKDYTIVLRPSVPVALIAGLAAACGEEIVFDDVKVERPGSR